jgi:hypothetical protein
MKILNIVDVSERLDFTANHDPSRPEDIVLTSSFMREIIRTVHEPR